MCGSSSWESNMAVKKWKEIPKKKCDGFHKKDEEVKINVPIE